MQGPNAADPVGQAVGEWPGGVGRDAARQQPARRRGEPRHSLCLVKPVGDEDWYRGSLYDDGSIDCWTAYGDLPEALRGL